MLKGKRSLQVISGALAASGAGTTLVSANPPQKEQKNEGVDNTRNLKGYKYEDVLKGTVVALISATGVGLIILAIWALVHQHVAIIDLDGFLIRYHRDEMQLFSVLSDICEEKKRIEKLKNEINNIPVICENGINVDPKTITYEELQKILENFGEYSEETIRKISNIEDDIQKIKKDFLKLLEDNKEALRVLKEVYSNESRVEDFEVGNVLELFEKSVVYEKFGPKNNYKDIVDHLLVAMCMRLHKKYPDFFSATTNLDNLYNACIDYLKGENENILTMSKNKDFISDIKNIKDRFEKFRNSLKIWLDNILPAFNKAKRAVSDLEKSLKDPNFEKEREERSNTKEKLGGLSNKKLSLKQSLSRLNSYEGRKTKLEQYLEKYQSAHELARKRKKSLENNFWDFGKDFFKLHGNEDLHINIY